MTSLDWDKYISTFCMGTKKYLLNDNMSNLHKARQKLKRYNDMFILLLIYSVYPWICSLFCRLILSFIRRRTIRYTINFVMFLLATQLLYLRSHIAREVWSNALGMCLNWLKKLSAFVINWLHTIFEIVKLHYLIIKNKFLCIVSVSILL